MTISDQLPVQTEHNQHVKHAQSGAHAPPAHGHNQHPSPHTLAEATGVKDIPFNTSAGAEFRERPVVRERSAGGDDVAIVNTPSVEDVRAQAIADAHARRAGPGSNSGYLHGAIPGVSSVSGDGTSALDRTASALPAAHGDQMKHHADMQAQVHGLQKRGSEELLKEALAEQERKKVERAKELALHEEIERNKRR